MNKTLRYSHYDIVMQEVPNETTLAIDITGCPYRCPGCHSPFLWDYFGNVLKDKIEELISKYKDYITCVCFMGGDQNMEDLISLCEIVKSYHIKTCLYTGCNNRHKFDSMLKYLDYLKIGPYIEECGGLDKKTTNQVFYKVVDNELVDITYKFQEKKY